MANAFFHTQSSLFSSGWSYYDHTSFEDYLNEVIYGQGYDETSFPMSTKRDYREDMRVSLFYFRGRQSLLYRRNRK